MPIEKGKPREVEDLCPTLRMVITHLHFSSSLPVFYLPWHLDVFSWEQSHTMQQGWALGLQKGVSSLARLLTGLGMPLPAALLHPDSLLRGLYSGCVLWAHFQCIPDLNKENQKGRALAVPNGPDVTLRELSGNDIRPMGASGLHRPCPKHEDEFSPYTEFASLRLSVVMLS